MAPPLPRALLRAPVLVSPASSYTTMNALIRSFSSTSLREASKIPPESPLFINVPNPPLSQAVEDQHISPLMRKGHLPVPRSIFRGKTRTVLPKTSPEFVVKSVPRPTSEKSKRPPLNEAMAWRRRMANLRRRNLREGIQGLWRRKRRTTELRRELNRTKLRTHDALMKAPQREDERLTETSVPAALLDTVVRQDPNRYATALEAQQRTAQILARKSEDRIDALQKLYMQARTFIVTEEELEAQVEKLFQPDSFNRGNSYAMVGTSIWDTEGPPKTIQRMMNEVMGTVKDEHVGDDEASVTAKRQQRVAEELTGGPLNPV